MTRTVRKWICLASENDYFARLSPFPVNESGELPVRSVHDHSASFCNHVAFLRKALHFVKLPFTPASPQRAWAALLVAPPSTFAQKTDVKPVGGRGISAFSSVFFAAVNFVVHPSQTQDGSGCGYELACISLLTSSSYSQKVRMFRSEGSAATRMP